MKRDITGRLIFYGLVGAFLFISMMSCAGRQTAKQMDYQFMAGYNAQASDYMRQALRDDLTEEQIAVLRAKRLIFIEVYPLIKAYDSYVQQGQVPDAALQQQILELMNRLESMVVR